jgi:hypothetical protein
MTDPEPSEPQRRFDIALGLIDLLVDELIKLDPEMMHQWEMSEFDLAEDPEATDDERTQGNMLRDSVLRMFDRQAKGVAANDEGGSH